MKPEDRCPCGSGDSYRNCCGRYIGTGTPAPTAERLMRSRYTAYVLGDAGYLSTTWHRHTRPPDLTLDGRVEWLRLEVRGHTGGRPGDSEGEVEFVAHYRAGGKMGRMHELSRFLFEDGRWFYFDGTTGKVPPKIGRNEPCPCGSGRKYKKCCGS